MTESLPSFTSMLVEPTTPQIQQAGMPPRHTPPLPIDKGACIALVTNALREAREREKAKEVDMRTRNNSAESLVSLQQQQQQRPGVTIDLSNRLIASIPPEVVELIKDEIERLALAHNQLTAFSDDFASLPRLRYLNLRSNFLKKFPAALTRIPSLEILDVSRNRLRLLPQDFGTLMSLKVLSMSKNKISVLPTYIGDMKELKILKADHNPLVFPPKEILEGDADRNIWLENLKRYLREKKASALDTESGSSSDEGGGGGEDNGFSSLSTTVARSKSFESEPSDSNFTTARPLKPGAAGGPDTPKSFIIRKKRVNNPSPPLPTSSTMLSQPQTPLSASLSQSNLSLAERSRSNSESVIQPQGTRNRRMGMLGPRKNTGLTIEGLHTVDEQKSVKHQRGYSHDSIIDNVQRTAQKGKPAEGGDCVSHSPTDKERQPGPYFRRLSSLPEHKRSSLSSARVGEAARGILYAMSTLQRPIEQYIQSSSDPTGPHHKVERGLYNGNSHIGALVGALESYEDKDDDLTVGKVIDACQSCVAAFGQVLTMLQSSLRESASGVAGPDVRYMRTLLLMVYGSYVEIQNSYEILKPLLVNDSAPETMQSQANTNLHPRLPHGTRLKSLSNASSTPSIASMAASNSYTGVPPPLPTPTTPGMQLSVNMSQQSDGGFDHDAPLYNKFQTATSVAIATLPIIEREVKATVMQNTQPSTALKLREVSSLCITGTEAAKKLSKIKWDAVQDGDLIERRRFWDDTNRFTNVVINIAELIKSVSQEVTAEYRFPRSIRTAVGTVVRPTRDLYILMNGSSFRHMAEQLSSPQGSVTPGQYSGAFAFQSMIAPMPATPLSAALGPAAQATLPQGSLYAGHYLNGASGYSSRSGTLMSQSHPTMSSTTSSDIGYGFPGVSGGGGGHGNPMGLMSPGRDMKVPPVKLS